MVSDDPRIYYDDGLPYVKVEVDWHNMESVRDKLTRSGYPEAAKWSYEAIVQFALMEASIKYGP
jgi:hypothetical protein